MKTKNNKPEHDTDYILDTVWSYQKSKIIMAANEYDLFTYLDKKPRTKEEIAKGLNAKTKAIELLLNALVSIKVLKKEDNQYQNTKAANKCLVKNNPGYYGDMIKHINDTSQSWGELEKHIFKTKPKIENQTERFTRAMDNSAKEKGREMAEKIPLKDKEKLLDIGGGSGAYSLAFIEKNPRLKATILDLKETIKVTEKLLKNIPHKERIKTLSQDYEKELPTGYDAVLLSNIIHSNTNRDNQRLIEKCHKTLDKDGILIIHDYILNNDKTEPEEAAIFALHMLLYNKDARTYSWKEIEEWLKKAGFDRFKRIEISDSRAITAEKKQ